MIEQTKFAYTRNTYFLSRVSLFAGLTQNIAKWIILSEF